MSTDPITNALWDAAEAEKRFARLLTQLQALHTQLPDEFDATVVPLLDEFKAAHYLLKALKYDLIHNARER